MDDIFNSPPETKPFEVGEVAIVVYSDNSLVPVGTEATIVATRESPSMRIYIYLAGDSGHDYIIQTSDGATVLARHELLRRKRPPKEQDINSKVNWEDVPWKPEQVVLR